MSDFLANFKDRSFVAFDTETTGQYPLTAELCEIGAVKWRDGEIVDRYEKLIKPKVTIPDAVIKIHGITNEMVADAPSIEEVIREMRDFLDDSVLLAHHAAFDMGFLAIEFENQNLAWPKNDVICTSRLSRKVITEAKNHRLQTLIPLLGLTSGQAHRALDDAIPCLELGFKCLERMGQPTMKEIEKKQGVHFKWEDYSMLHLLEEKKGTVLIRAIREKKNVRMQYHGGSSKGKFREVEPTGIVRSPDGDYLVAICQNTMQKKRYYLDKIGDTETIV